MSEERRTRTNGLLLAAGAMALGALLLLLFAGDTTEVRVGAGVLAVVAAGLVGLTAVRTTRDGEGEGEAR